MSELQIGLIAIGALVVGGVLAYNRLQEARARREAERAFGSGHGDVLLDKSIAERASASAAASPGDAAHDVQRQPGRGGAADADAHPDAAIDYIIEFSAEHPVVQGSLREQWSSVERRHARRALLAGSEDGRSWRAALQLVSRDGAIGEADLIEFRSAVETLATAVGATVSAPEMRAAVEAARGLDDFCAQTDIQVVLHVNGGPFPGTKIRAAAEASGLALEADGRFAARDDAQRLLYTLGSRDSTPFSAATMKDAAPQSVSLLLDVPRAPDTRRSFEAMARLAQQLAAVLGGQVVDDADRALDERGLAAIAAQLDAVRATFDARGLEPGGPAALRLFS